MIIPEFVSQAEVGNKECLHKPNCKCAARGNGPRASRAETETGGCKNVGKISLPPDLLELIPGLVTAKQWAEGDCRGARELSVYVSEQNAKNFPGSEYRVFCHISVWSNLRRDGAVSRTWSLPPARQIFYTVVATQDTYI